MRIPHGLRAALAGQAGAAADADFKSVSLLLHGDGTNGAQNNTFIDSSTNSFTITRNGNTTQGTSNPFGNNWTAFFDGTGDYLTLSANSAFELGTSNFTLEAWVIASSAFSGSFRAICQYGNATVSNYANISYAFFVNDTGFLSFQASDGTGAFVNLTSSTAFPIGIWRHVAIVRSGSSFTLYQNGASVATATASSSMHVPSSPLFWIGRNHDGGQDWLGYISNIRLVKGTAVYTSTFTPPTIPLTAITNTSLLACHVNGFIDGSTNAFTITRYGDASVQRFSPFAPTDGYSTTSFGGSGYFDGTGDSLSLSSTDLNLGSNDFTIEAWVYTTKTSTQCVVGSIQNSNGTGAWMLNLNYSSNKLRFFCRYGGGSVLDYTADSGTFPANQWAHVAVTRSGANLRIFLNGTQVGTTNTTLSTSSIDNASTNYYIGRTTDTAIQFQGYISSLRVLIGTAQYTANFTPATSPLTAITNTSLLCNFTNGGIIDNAMMNNLETVGNTQISTSVKKYGTGSIYFDGTDDYLLVPSSPNWDFGTGDFTVEFWINFSSIGSDTVVGKWGSGAGKYAWVVQLDSSNLTFYSGNNGSLSTQYTFSWSVTTGTWYHVAVARSGTSLRAFLGGTQIGTTQTSTQSLSATGSFCCIGENLDLGGQSAFVHGYIDDLRITKGVARYTANFTPPTAAFSDK